MTDFTPPPGKTWADLQKQGTENDATPQGTCELCGIALYGWEPKPERKHCGYCEARLEQTRDCVVCGQGFQARRRDAGYCSDACRMRAYRARKAA